VLLDLVPNHSSDRHPWFRESRSSRGNPKRDWYIWRDPAPDGGPPNNWLSIFGGSAWQHDPATGQYYYHAFLAQQPDLNWRNPQLRTAIYDVMRFWLKRGVDGFRVDVIWHLIKDEHFRDNPPNPEFKPGDPPPRALTPLYTADRPEIHDILAEMRRVSDEFADRVLIGEIYLPIDRLVTYYGRDLAGVHLPFNFHLLGAPWHARTIGALIDEYEAALPPGGWPNWVLGNHDRPRVASRVGPEQARVAAMLLLTLRGTPTLYNGEEIGMEQVAIPPDRARDPCALYFPGAHAPRDGCRTPMQWDAGAHAGFSAAEPWLPLAENFAVNNVAAQRADDTSIYRLHQRLLRLRRSRKALQLGNYRPIDATGELLLFVRELGRERLLVALNLGGQPAEAALAGGRLAGRVLLSTFGDRDGEAVAGSLNLRGNEGIVVELSADSVLP
jgi:alpha-glucosidase